PRPLTTAVMDPFTFPQRQDMSIAFARVKAAGATVVRLQVSWKEVAPVSPPRSFEASNPADRHYNWSSIDAQVRAAASAGLDPIVNIVDAPNWAQPSHRADANAG